MKYGKKEIKRVPRYSLILVKRDGTQYYYDFDGGTFVRMEENEVAPKTTLEKIDALTSCFPTLESFVGFYGFHEPIKLLKISYKLKGEQMIQPTFGNKDWGLLAKTYKGQEVDFRSSHHNLGIFEEIYTELVNLDNNNDSRFGDFLVRLKGISPKTIDIIKLALTNERAARNRYKGMFPTAKATGTISFVEGIYQDDRDAFKEAFKRRMSNYRELRTAYLNYCKFFKRKEQKEIAIQMEMENLPITQEIKTVEPKEEGLSKKKVIEPPRQMSMFDL